MIKMTEKQGVKKDTRTKKNESGRSMVEMLGVLAIMRGYRIPVGDGHVLRERDD